MLQVQSLEEMIAEVVRTIGNTEVEDLNRCERYHYFAHGLNLIKRESPKALATGIHGHEVLALYYRLRQRGISRARAATQAMMYIDEVVSQHDLRDEIEMMITTALMPFFKTPHDLPEDDWDILEIEKSYEVRGIPGAINNFYGLTVDLLIQEKSTGKIKIVDHKFCNDFWTAHKISLASQPRKYAWALRQKGVPVEGTILQQFRYRSLKEPTWNDRFRAVEVNPDHQEQDNYMREHVKTANKAARFWSMGLQEWYDNTTIQKNYASCQGCQFTEACVTTLQGGSPKEFLMNEFVTNEKYSEQYNTPGFTMEKIEL